MVAVDDNSIEDDGPQASINGPPLDKNEEDIQKMSLYKSEINNA